jgi:dTDP-4-amino-4,6-dideoxygalactose transaminase
MLHRFEEAFATFTGQQAVALANGGAALLALYEYIGVKDADVVVPANTFWATTIAAKRAGANIIYADCNREDLCLSLDDLKRKVTPRTKAVCVVHIGGHIAFQIEEIAAFCRERDIALIEDCAHAHGAAWNGRAAGTWGIGGAWSFYATKTMPLGEGGMVTTTDSKLAEWLRCYRNYGKVVENGKVSYSMTDGFNFRMNEVTAALGVVQIQRLPEILAWKRTLAAKYDQIFERRIRFPQGMTSGYYKYIVFDTPLKEETGKVFNISDFGNVIENLPANIPNSCWIAEHHRCAPIWFGWPHATKRQEYISEYLLDTGSLPIL